MAEIRHATHDKVPPLIDGDCHTLVLGSMLSPKSAEAGFYYAHPQNRFWPLLARIFGEELPLSVEGRRRLALRHGIALWDVLFSCDIEGAADSTIKNAVPNDIADLLARYPNIKRVFTTGCKSFKLLKKYNKTAKNAVLAAAVKLPSPSPMNCAMSIDDLFEYYLQLKNAP